MFFNHNEVFISRTEIFMINKKYHITNKKINDQSAYLLKNQYNFIFKINCIKLSKLINDDV
jgi:hypothetical protein